MFFTVCIYNFAEIRTSKNTRVSQRAVSLQCVHVCQVGKSQEVLSLVMSRYIIRSHTHTHTHTCGCVNTLFCLHCVLFFVS